MTEPLDLDKIEKRIRSGFLFDLHGLSPIIDDLVIELREAREEIARLYDIMKAEEAGEREGAVEVLRKRRADDE